MTDRPLYLFGYLPELGNGSQVSSWPPHAHRPEVQAAGLRVIAAWGNSGSLLGRAEAVMQFLEGCDVECLGATSARHPRHPLYVAGDAMPVQFWRSEEHLEVGAH